MQGLRHCYLHRRSAKDRPKTSFLFTLADTGDILSLEENEKLLGFLDDMINNICNVRDTYVCPKLVLHVQYMKYRPKIE